MAATNPLRLPRGLRNNNPGNIRISPTRYKGEIVPSSDRAFKQFKSRGWGYRAIFVLLESYHKRQDHPADHLPLCSLLRERHRKIYQLGVRELSSWGRRPS